MMNRYILLALLLSLACLSLRADDETTFRDFFNNSKITYVSKYKELKSNPFNLFDEISVNYPVISGYPEANNKLYYYCVPYLETDSFKLEVLQRAKIASGIYITEEGREDRYSQYVYNNHMVFLPSIDDVDFRFVFLFDGVLAVNFTYTYTVGGSGEKLDENFTMEKQLFIRLRDGNVSKPEDLIAVNKRSAFKSDLEKRIRRFAETHKPEKDEDEVDYNDNEEGDYERTPRKKQETEIVLNELVFRLNPFGAVIHIPAYSVNSSNCYGLGADLSYTFAELKPFLDATGPLKNFITYNKEFRTSLKQFNLYKETHFTHWRGESSPQHDNNVFRTAPAGVKAIRYSVCYKNQSDSAAQLQRIRLFDASGKLTEEQYYNNGPGKMSSNKVFEYDKAGQLVKITTNARQRDDNSTQTFRYDAAGNLVERTEKSSDGSATYRYIFDNLTVFEITESDEADEDGNNIREYHLTPEGKIIDSRSFGEEQSYIAFYDGNRIMGSRRIKQPNLDNSIYCYDNNGKLLTIQEDNGRHLYEHSYNTQGQLQSLIHMDSRQLKDRWVYEYNSKGLRSACNVYDNMYGYGNANNTYRYLYQYEFY